MLQVTEVIHLFARIAEVKDLFEAIESIYDTGQRGETFEVEGYYDRRDRAFLKAEVPGQAIKLSVAVYLVHADAISAVQYLTKEDRDRIQEIGIEAKSGWTKENLDSEENDRKFTIYIRTTEKEHDGTTRVVSDVKVKRLIKHELTHVAQILEGSFDHGENYEENKSEKEGYFVEFLYLLREGELERAVRLFNTRKQFFVGYVSVEKFVKDALSQGVANATIMKFKDMVAAL